MTKKVRDRKRPNVGDANRDNVRDSDRDLPDDNHNRNASSEQARLGRDKAPAQERVFPVDDIKFQIILIMQLQGRNQKEIADALGVTDRTIRNWVKQLRGRKLGIPEHLDSQREVERMLLRFDAREAEILKWKNEAEASHDIRSSISCSKALRQLSQERYTLLKDLGLFLGYQVKCRSQEDSSGRQADLLTDFLGQLIGADIDRPEDTEEA
jgi:transposase-like protein